MTLPTGIHTITAEEYHADPCETPSLSSGIAKILLDRPPYWAWAAHPKLNPDHKPSPPKPAFDIGSAAHAMLLENGAGIKVCEFDNWLTKDAKAQRDMAREEGITPILASDYERTQEMARVASEILLAYGLDVKQTANEVTMIAEVDSVLCRIRADIHIHRKIIDYKTTGVSLDNFARQASKFGYDLQAAMYMRVAEELGEKCEWLFLVQETVAPYPVQIFRPTMEFLEVGKRKFAEALNIWHECMLLDEWPGYPTDIQMLDAMPWDLNDLNSEHEENLLKGVD
jgi:hypothetical protein